MIDSIMLKVEAEFLRLDPFSASVDNLIKANRPKSSSKVERTGVPNFWLYAQFGLLRAAR